jgi:hypothetical protein
VIDDEVHEQDLWDYQDEASKIKANCIPKMCYHLKSCLIYKLSSEAYESKDNNSTMMHFSGESRDPEQPKYINLGTCCSEEEKHTFTVV